jgi:hypothetical protein
MRDNTATPAAYDAKANREPVSMASDLVAEMFDDQWGSVGPIVLRHCPYRPGVGAATRRHTHAIRPNGRRSARPETKRRWQLGNIVIPGVFRLTDNLSATAALLTVAS